jgi:transposase
MPERYGSYTTAWRRLKRWSEERVWNEIMESLRDSAYNDGKFSMDIVCVDSSFIETKKGEKIPLTTVTRGEME